MKNLEAHRLSAVPLTARWVSIGGEKKMISIENDPVLHHPAEFVFTYPSRPARVVKD